MNTVDFGVIDKILEQNDYSQAKTIAILQDIQEEYRYIPKESFQYVADKLGISCAKLYSVATFYENFSLEPKGKYVIKICDGTACHVRKSVPILEHFRKELGLSGTKHTSDDGLFTVETVSCLGACGLAPAIVVNDHVHPTMTVEKAQAIIDQLRGEENA
ncbi:MAG: NAD(P)H-dependent oxidoreductase subunit E [Clostridia bacterium]|nr:NAD(P)H-dependent oxidoreductase subunit E [Clostridia bacterium]MBR5266313.1 NAD(P)H-dependent oxidoreductase subunit E [Clostridia bacterium]